MKKVICYKLRQSDLEVLKNGVSKYKDLQMLESSSNEKLLKTDLELAAGLYIFVDESLEISKLEELLKYFNTKPVNIILKYKDFEALMLCYKYQVSSVFEAKLKESDVENSLVKIDLLGKKVNEHLPVTEVVKLFSSPVKIKSNSELYHRLSSYLNSFNSLKRFSLFVVSELGVNWIGEKFDIDLEFLETREDLPRKFIGFEHKVEDTNHPLLLTPVYTNEDELVWLVAEVNLEQSKYIFNDLFYKFVENVLIYRINKEKEMNLTVLATTDEVTGLFNQRKLSDDLEMAILEHQKQHKNFSIMFIDIDHFKSVNDNYGHVVGSKLLQDIGEVLSLILRASDHIYRYGGDEFVVIMPNVDIQTVHDIAKRVLVKIKNKEFDIGNGEKYKLSVSIGIAEYPTDAKSAIEIIRFADEMMYMSKRSGRGKVFHVSEVEHADASS